jgi:dTMP kinase
VIRPHPLPRGVLIALEGIDGTGKSTQTQRLTAIFKGQGVDILPLHEPTDSPWGRRLREAMRGQRRVLAPVQELDLFLQDRHYDVAAHIRPALAAHKLVLIDRYYYSTIAYQGALGLDPDRIRQLNEAFAPIPDAVFVLLLSPAHALARIRLARGHTDELFEREDYLKKVDEIFRTLNDPHIHVVAADQPLDVVTSSLRGQVQGLIDP